MSKRKNRKSSAPNLPKETLERARQEAGLGSVPLVTPSEESEPDEAAPEAPIEAAMVAKAPEIKRAQPTRRKTRRKQLTYEEMTAEDVAYALAHPTIEVTEEALREQYGYVLADLRSMAILAAILFVALIVIAGVIVT